MHLLLVKALNPLVVEPTPSSSTAQPSAGYLKLGRSRADDVSFLPCNLLGRGKDFDPSIPIGHVDIAVRVYGNAARLRELTVSRSRTTKLAQEVTGKVVDDVDNAERFQRNAFGRRELSVARTRSTLLGNRVPVEVNSNTSSAKSSVTKIFPEGLSTTSSALTSTYSPAVTTLSERTNGHCLACSYCTQE
jgi:hypothetical protein